MDRLSVSFAPDYERERTSWSETDFPPPPLSPGDLPSDASVKVNVFNMNEGGSGGGGASPSPVMPPGQGQYPGNRLSLAVASGLTNFISFSCFMTTNKSFCKLLLHVLIYILSVA